MVPGAGKKSQNPACHSSPPCVTPNNQSTPLTPNLALLSPSLLSLLVPSQASRAMPSRSPCTKTNTRHARATSQRTARWKSGAKSAAAAQAVSSSDADVLRLAEEISREAGELIKRKLGADIVKTKANARDLLTEVDTEVQDLLETRVRERFPDHYFLGEESGISLDEALDHSPEWLWIVDPIDGTTNFVHGIPMCAVSVGVAHREELAVGVIHDPFRD